MEQAIKELIDQVKALEKAVADLTQWKEARERQQLTEPLDYPSKNIVKRAAQ
jgi:hypothetical protein